MLKFCPFRFVFPNCLPTVVVGLGVGVGVGVAAALPKYNPLTTADLPPSLFTVIFTRPFMVQTNYWPPFNDEIVRLSKRALLAQSKISTL